MSLETTGVLISIISTAVAIYQFAILRAAKKRRGELQFLLAGIHQIALAKQLEWSDQIAFLNRQDERDLEVFRVHLRARDNLMEIASAITALEGVIDTDTSAISKMLQKNIDQARLNNELQAETFAKAPTVGDSVGPDGGNGDER